jgi:hypothetical protein
VSRLGPVPRARREQPGRLRYGLALALASLIALAAGFGVGYWLGG